MLTSKTAAIPWPAETLPSTTPRTKYPAFSLRLALYYCLFRSVRAGKGLASGEHGLAVPVVRAGHAGEGDEDVARLQVAVQVHAEVVVVGSADEALVRRLRRAGIGEADVRVEGDHGPVRVRLVVGRVELRGAV